MFRRLLVANRGEIAARVLRACRELDIEGTAVHSVADAGAPWLDLAVDSVCIGPARADRSYLNADAVLQAAEQLGAQAIHPGYGFLSENAVFAARCRQHGIQFVGPSAAAIQTMGDKALAKKTVAAVGLPTIPGSPGPLADLDEARTMAERAGYPVLLKASAGGGGKGMRRCDAPGDLERAYREARMEAEKAFGNPELYLEKLIVGARHIEFQLLCDHFGKGLHLGERDCSIQRKHQKLIEEAPSPAVSDEERRGFGSQVAEAMADLGYRNAGTVEFLRDSSGQFYFMEMNTRLQVEHPVTEMVTGVDLVAEQIRIAANRPLGLDQDAIEWNGHAIELRINAENPADDFRPDPGLVEGFTAPQAEIGPCRVRWDSAIRDGYRIPPHYDSMVGKLIVHGPNRHQALDGALAALEQLEVGGRQTTAPLQARLLRDEGFRSGAFDIDYLNRSGLLKPEGAA